MSTTSVYWYQVVSLKYLLKCIASDNGSRKGFSMAGILFVVSLTFILFLPQPPLHPLTASWVMFIVTGQSCRLEYRDH